MLRFGSFYDLLFFLVLEAIPFHLSGDPHAQLKPGDKGTREVSTRSSFSRSASCNRISWSCSLIFL